MRLRLISATCALLVTGLLAISTAYVSRRVLLRNYESLETEHAIDHVRGIRSVVQSEIADLDRTANDYAAWDQTYRFMHIPTRRFVESELSSDALTMLNVHLMMLLDEEGSIDLLQSYGRNPIGSRDIDRLHALGRILIQQPGKNRAGLLELPSGPCIVSARPILPTGGKGDPRGMLIMVRMIDDRLLLAWSDITTVPFQVSGAMFPVESYRAQMTLRQNSPPTIETLNSDVLAVRATIPDLSGYPSFILSYRHPHDIVHQGLNTIRLLVGSLLSLGLLFGCANLWLMDRFVVARIQRLIYVTREIRGTKGLAARVVVSGRDEISELGLQMNRMLSELQDSHKALLLTQEKLRFEATHDHLTGVANRAAALDFFAREISRAKRDGSSVAVILIDVDHFKRINDTHGHSAGDVVLQGIARTISTNVRDFDMVARYGGEEFLIISPGCDLSEAVHLAQRLLNDIGEMHICVEGAELSVTASAGVTVTSISLSEDDAIKLADCALYRAKNNGRNRVEAELLPSALSADSVFN